ncbi:hypothetical protein FQ192_07970 [Pseudomonas sp. ANT_J12]|jgi:hypothetical protein|uniref:hypothetical protein n=1 Tax=Pseudomonas sp. ANT_J12 TaxID=2597351 RepID=UPI0011F2BDE6|nr:hypothetical protein [Pseudomonas sp. ANT_J12]KAA0995965.1 hypothetical protein FQ192_07970 [Pseudomonas sp. ANT_J12]
MDVIVELAKSLCVVFDVIGVLLIIMVRWKWHTTVGWGCTGIVLLIIAVGNTLVMYSTGLNPSGQISSLLGIIVFGALGSRFLGNWLTEGAAVTAQKSKK